MPLITAAQLARMASKAMPRVVNAIVDHADDVLPRYGIVTPLRLQHFLAHVFVETGYLRRIEEDLSYTAERMHVVWPRRFPTVASAKPYEHRPEALAAVVYGGRMGNSTAEEAWANRGQGLLNNTGHDNLVALAGKLGIGVDEVRPMLTSEAWMLECAAATFVMLGCLPQADRDDIRGTTHAINGGLTGLDLREAALKLCRRVWTPTAVISPAALIPKPITPQGAQTVTPNDTARLVGAIERLAADPRTAAVAERALGGATKVLLAAPATGWLAGKKTYILAGFGVLGTVAAVAQAMELHGGLTPAGWCAAIIALVTSGGFATIRSAIKAHFGLLADLVLQMGQGALLEAIGADAALAAPAAAASPVDAVEGAIGAAAASVADLLPH